MRRAKYFPPDLAPGQQRNNSYDVIFARIQADSNYILQTLNAILTIIGPITPGNVNIARGNVSGVFYAGGDPLSAGTRIDVVCPYNGTITQAEALLDVAGSATIDVRRCTYADYDGGVTHPGPGDSISDGNPIAPAVADKYKDTTLTGWTTAVNAGDIIEFYLSTVSTATWIFVQIQIAKS